MFTFMEVEDTDKWIEGFKAHADSKTGTWGYEVPITRGEFCDDSKTRIFKSVSNEKRVAVYIEAIDMTVLGPMLGDENFQKLTTDLGEKAETKQMKILTAPPPPPGA